MITVMAKNIEKVMTGWYVSVNVKDDFTSFCADNGSKIQDSVNGALVIWQYLPSLIRESAIQEAKGIGTVDKKFWAEFCMGIEAGMKSQLKGLHDKQKR